MASVTVVSGVARSGTSLMMQTLLSLGIKPVGDRMLGDRKALGAMKRDCPTGTPPTDAEVVALPFLGTAYLKDNLVVAVTREGETYLIPPERRSELTEGLRRRRRFLTGNPKGYFENPDVVFSGFSIVPKEWNGGAVKVIARALTKIRPIDGVQALVFCLRDPKEIIVSASRHYRESAQEDSPADLLAGWVSFVRFVTLYPELVSRTLVVDYAEMFTNPPLAKLASLCGVYPSESQFEEARRNIEPKLHRSKVEAWQGWPEEFQPEGAFVERMYPILREFRVDEFPKLLEEAICLIDSRDLDHRPWVDDADTWAVVNSLDYRRMQKDEPFRASKAMPEKHRACNCPHYDREEHETYSVTRSSDLGSLVRSKVGCARLRALLTVEACQQCWLNRATWLGTDGGGAQAGPGCGVS